MKLSHLSLAIFAAISLAACGGGSDNAVDNTNPTPKPDPNQGQQPKPQNPDLPDADKIVDPTQTGVVGKLDLKVDASQGTLQYLRGKKSNFDKIYNPNKEASATAILGVNLNEQNPQLSNIVLAELPDNDGHRLVQFAGNWGSDAANIWDPRSLQQQNLLNVKLATPDGYDATIKDVSDYVTQLEARKKEFQDALDQYTDAAINGLSTNAEKDKARLQKQILAGVVANIDAAMKAVKSDDSYITDVASLNNFTDYAWGDGVATTADAMDDDGVDFTSSKGPQAVGLVAMNYHAVKDPATTELLALDVQGQEEQSRSSTRIFGRNFDTNDAVTLGSAYSDVKNSYLGPALGLSVDLGNGFNAGSDINGSMSDFDAWMKDTYGDRTASPTVNATKPKQQARFNLGVIPTNLMKVQYGRVTNDLDPPKGVYTFKKSIEYKRQNFLNKGDDTSVDTYFYRGVDATTLKQMDALKDKKMTYQGHALMYGIDNSWHGNLGDKLPNAYGTGSSHGIGHFVTADVDLSDKTIRGGIYNAWQIGNEVKRDFVVAFTGKIHGNTALGDAYRPYKPDQKGDLRASFFGMNAEEMGGSVNAIKWQQAYGPDAGQDIWGGVFGAQRAAGSNLSNKWLGDIPKIN